MVSSRSPSSGLWMPIHGARIASAITTIIHASASATPSSRGPRLRALARWTVVASVIDAMTHPWVEQGIGHVDGEVDQHEAGGDHQHHALDGEVVVLVNGVDQHLANARDREQRLDDHRAADETAEVDADHRH